MNEIVHGHNVGRWCLSEDECIAQGINFAAYERGISDAADAFERNHRASPPPTSTTPTFYPPLPEPVAWVGDISEGRQLLLDEPDWGGVPLFTAQNMWAYARSFASSQKPIPAYAEDAVRWRSAVEEICAMWHAPFPRETFAGLIRGFENELAASHPPPGVPPVPQDAPMVWPSGETLAQREAVCAAWCALPDDLRKDERLKPLYYALGGFGMESIDTSSRHGEKVGESVHDDMFFIPVDPITDAEQVAVYNFTLGTPHYEVVRKLYRLASAHVNGSGVAAMKEALEALENAA